MNESNSTLSSVELVLAIDRTGSATRAAQRLGTTTATVLRRLATFESQIGALLFDRGARGLRPTNAMALVRPWAEQAESAAVNMLREVTKSESKPRGSVRLAVPPLVATLMVVPALKTLREKYPEIVVELVPATATVDLSMREADLAIRTTRPEKGDLVAQHLGTFPFVAVRSPALATSSFAGFADLPWLTWERAMSHIPEAKWIAGHVPDSRIVFRCSELSAMVSAAQAGLGVTLVADEIARRAGGLLPLDLPTPPLPTGEIFLVAHTALRQVPRVAAVWSWIVSSFRKARPQEAHRGPRTAKPSGK